MYARAWPPSKGLKTRWGARGVTSCTTSCRAVAWCAWGQKNKSLDRKSISLLSWRGLRIWLWVKTNGIPFWARCTHFSSGDWDAHWGYDLDFDPHTIYHRPQIGGFARLGSVPFERSGKAGWQYDLCRGHCDFAARAARAVSSLASLVFPGEFLCLIQKVVYSSLPI